MPLVLSSIITGISNMGDSNNLGRLGRKIMLFYAMTSPLSMGVFGFAAKTVSSTGFAAFSPLLIFFVTVTTALIFYLEVTLSMLLKYIGRANPLEFFKLMVV